MTEQDLKQKYISAYVHEMNNIAANIAGAVDILLENKVTDPDILEKYLKIVSYSVGDLKGQIHNLLTLNKISEYKEEIINEDFDLNEKCKDIVASLQPRAEKKKIKLNFKSNLKQHITADCDKLSMVIRNLVGNAVKFTEKGEVKLELKQTPKKLEITVTDTGLGIEEEKIPSLFECYSQGEDKKEGFGIGLYITKHFVEMHKGTIEVKSKKGEGSVFKVTFTA